MSLHPLLPHKPADTTAADGYTYCTACGLNLDADWSLEADDDVDCPGEMPELPEGIAEEVQRMVHDPSHGVRWQRPRVQRRRKDARNYYPPEPALSDLLGPLVEEIAAALWLAAFLDGAAGGQWADQDAITRAPYLQQARVAAMVVWQQSSLKTFSRIHYEDPGNQRYTAHGGWSETPAHLLVANLQDFSWAVDPELERKWALEVPLRYVQRDSNLPITHEDE